MNWSQIHEKWSRNPCKITKSEVRGVSGGFLGDSRLQERKPGQPGTTFFAFFCENGASQPRAPIQTEWVPLYYSIQIIRLIPTYHVLGGLRWQLLTYLPFGEARRTPSIFLGAPPARSRP